MPHLFGKKLRYLRLQHNITQADLARRLGMKRAHINNLEAGRRAASLDLVVQAADVFGVTSDYLLRDAIPIEMVSSRMIAQPVASESPPRLLGSKLRYLRTERNLTQTDVATALGLAANAFVSLLEADKKEPSPDLVVQLADLFGVSTDYLVDDAIPVQQSP